MAFLAQGYGLLLLKTFEGILTVLVGNGILNTPYAGKVTGLKVSRGAADAGLAKMGD